MPPKTFRLLPILVAALLSGVACSLAQVPKSDFQIGTIVPAFYSTPAFSGAQYDKRVSTPGKWLEIEVPFDWNPAVKAAYTDELTFNYYVVLNNAAMNTDRKPTMLTGTVTHVNIAPQRGMHSSMYVSPHTLARLFGAALRVPGAPTTALVDVGITISLKGQVVAEASWKGHGEWWSQFTPTGGLLLPKSETPFAPLAWDYYEETKSRSAQ